MGVYIMKHTVMLTCEQCKKEFKCILYQAATRRFCGRECYLDYCRIHGYHGTKKAPLITKICEWCNKPFEIKKSDSFTKYCSPSCREKGRRRTHRNMTGDASSQWKKGKWLANGYVMLSISGLPPEDQKLAVNMKYSYLQHCVAEHRLIMAKYLGRSLKKGEIVHHRNGIKDDNRLENLELTTHQQHANTILFGNHRLRCPKCGFAAEANAFDVIRRRPRPMKPEPIVTMPLFKS